MIKHENFKLYTFCAIRFHIYDCRRGATQSKCISGYNFRIFKTTQLLSFTFIFSFFHKWSITSDTRMFCYVNRVLIVFSTPISSLKSHASIFALKFPTTVRQLPSVDIRIWNMRHTATKTQNVWLPVASTRFFNVAHIRSFISLTDWSSSVPRFAKMTSCCYPSVFEELTVVNDIGSFD